MYQTHFKFRLEANRVVNLVQNTFEFLYILIETNNGWLL